MENVWHLFNNNNNNTSSERGQNNHSTTNNPHHHEWQPGNNLAQPYNFINNATPTTTITHCVQDGANYGPMFPHHHHIYSSSSSSTLFGTSSNESGGSTYYHPDPHLPSLKLGKRHYFENANNNNNNNVVVINRQQESEVIKKMKNLINGQEEFSWGGYGGLIWQPPSTSTATGPTVAPRCQVEGCSVMLVDAKYYHKRHKVCEKHSKAPKVMVLGIEQRFCQQCSR
ncbi:hypothetical protein LIER_43486 [Lithospermum erythrorhizon]|uniref:SBP-type domain-containing protein n=1 Tax=Lithospermum erythrorhizon TaxID=34254 RepID=A0AAV3Q7Y6_LITER